MYNESFSTSRLLILYAAFSYCIISPALSTLATPCRFVHSRKFHQPHQATYNDGVMRRGVATGGISVYIPPNQSTLKNFYVVFLSDIPPVATPLMTNIYTHPNKIPGYASAHAPCKNSLLLKYEAEGEQQNNALRLQFSLNTVGLRGPPCIGYVVWLN